MVAVCHRTVTGHILLSLYLAGSLSVQFDCLEDTVTFFAQEIKRTNRNWLVLCLLVSLGAVLIFGLFYNSFEHYLNQPIPIPRDATRLEAELSHPSESRQYQIPLADLQEVRIITYDGFVRKIVNAYSTVPDDQILAKMYVVKIGDKYLPVNGDWNRNEQSIIGVLYPLEPQIESMLSATPVNIVRAELYPGYLTTTQYIRHDFYFNGVAWLVTCLVVVWFWYRLASKMNKPENHPNAKTLQYYGNTPKSIQEIDTEFMNHEWKTIMPKQQDSRNWQATRHLFRTEFQKKNQD